MYSDDDRNHAEKEALDWFVRMQNDSVTEAEQAAFAAWRDANPQNAQAYADAELLSHKLAALKGHAAYHIPHLLPGRQKPSLIATRYFSRAALFLLVIFSSAALWWQTGITQDEYVTSTGEQRHITLVDGSRLELNTASRAGIYYTRLQRTITLYSGEAYFNVAHDKNRPFTVSADDLQVRDIGTRFIVRRNDEQVTVTVLEGEVELTRIVSQENRSEESSDKLTLLAGQQSHYRNGIITPVVSTDSTVAAAWREGKLIFKATPLREVVQELARYHPLRFVIHDPTLADETVTGSFHIRELSSFLRALEQVLQIRIDTRTPGIASIQRRKNQNHAR